MSKTSQIRLSQLLWDAWCIASIVGIWPRFIEPNWIRLSEFSLPIDKLDRKLEGLKVLQLSDLHFHSHFSKRLLKKIAARVKELSPDLVLFTGDFLCYSNLENPRELQEFLSSIQAPAGCFAVLGNHDYQEPTGVNRLGDYDKLSTKSSTLARALSQLISSPPPLTKKVTERAQAIGLHKELLKVISASPFRLLHNETELLSYRGAALNLCGLGEYTLGRALPHLAFENYRPDAPGIILVHNPDAAAKLSSYPGELILSGHTHGAQVNLPWLRHRFQRLENSKYLRGLFKLGKKWLYINRGLGSVFPFRWFSFPEITLFTLTREKT